MQTTLRHESERLESVDAELALQSEVIAGGQLALEAYAFAAMME